MRFQEFAAPLQALFFILICLSLVWMLYAMAFYDPTPPTMDEVNSDVTQDPHISDMRTSAAQTVNALFGFGPTQIFLVTPTPSLSPTVTPTVISVANTITPRPATNTPIVIEPTITDDRSRDEPPSQPTSRPPTQTFTPRPPKPTKVPTTSIPTDEPTEEPTEEPTDEPTDEPTEPPEEEPTDPPAATEAPAINSTQSSP